MSFFGRSQIYNQEPVPAGQMDHEYADLINEYREHKALLEKENRELKNEILKLQNFIKNLKPKETIVPAGKIDQRMYDLMKDMVHFYEIGSRSLSDAIRNDKFAEKLNTISRYISSIKTSEE